MRTIREVLRLKWEKGRSIKKISQSCKIARSTITDYLSRAKRAGVTWPLSPELDDSRLEALLYPARPADGQDKRAMPAMEYIRGELARKSVTLRILWLEYRQANPDGYQYSQFCLLYRQWAATLDVCLRQTHRAVEKLFVDFAGQTIPVMGPVSGKAHDADLFIAVLGAGNYTFAWALHSQDLWDWVDAHRCYLPRNSFLSGVRSLRDVVTDDIKVDGLAR